MTETTTEAIKAQTEAMNALRDEIRRQTEWACLVAAGALESMGDALEGES